MNDGGKGIRDEAAHLALGEEGERLAREYLVALGYEVVARNVRVRLGLSAAGRRIWGEIDLVAYERETLAFVEVKTRRGEGRYPVETAVGARKRRLLADSARRYRQRMGIVGEPYRFDVVTVVLREGLPPRIRLARGFFADRSSAATRGRAASS